MQLMDIIYIYITLLIRNCACDSSSDLTDKNGNFIDTTIHDDFKTFLKIRPLFLFCADPFVQKYFEGFASLNAKNIYIQYCDLALKSKIIECLNYRVYLEQISAYLKTYAYQFKDCPYNAEIDPV